MLAKTQHINLLVSRCKPHMGSSIPEGAGVLHQIFGNRVQHTKKKMNPIGAKVL